ncbi:exonuclease domain-containing protein [Corynebacterium timonense]|uniref:DNA polymerase-3 subunit epsilon n=1 Tax=Corynebacterium timonense TaxID=441500 RepID=A0A1H1MR93_9CORY|nr:exonuclease domain-containing protein [Corynebacterium timonense]SDR89314.1 DNA polymerase-3 subunit epsilon [Corynebacterium timonense]
MIPAHGATLSVTNSALVIAPTPLEAALTGSTEERSVPISDISHAGVARDADAWDCGVVELTLPTGALRIAFSPGDEAGPTSLLDLLRAARRGEAPEHATPTGGAGVPGLDFVGFDVETANQRWGSICQIGLVKIVDGEEVDRASWLCTPPESYAEFDPFNVSIHGISAEDVVGQPSVAQRVDELVDFVGDLPVVAHNAQFDATALREACLASEREVPTLLFACTLAHSRAARLDVANHKLPTLAEHFGVRLDDHHDACADAAACAGIMVELAREAGHTGSLMSLVHDAGFALGAVTPERVTPVLRDRSGAARSLQAEAARGNSPSAVAAAAASPRGSNQSDAGEPDAGGPRDAGRRQPAPWQSVATPDTVPDPNADADPSSPLYGHNVTLTGEFEPYDKGSLWESIAAQGASVGKNVTKKTTILVAGEWTTMTSKEKRARELQDKGQDIDIWPASKLFDALGLD